jgi:hypothetical protein
VGRHRDPGQPRDPLVRIDITLTLPPHQIVWLLAGAAISHLHTFGKIVEKAGPVLRTLIGDLIPIAAAAVAACANVSVLFSR